MVRPKARTERTILSKPLMAINQASGRHLTYSNLDAAPTRVSSRMNGRKLP
jgi:hypothetical protein